MLNPHLLESANNMAFAVCKTTGFFMAGRGNIVNLLRFLQKTNQTFVIFYKLAENTILSLTKSRNIANAAPDAQQHSIFICMKIVCLLS